MVDRGENSLRSCVFVCRLCVCAKQQQQQLNNKKELPTNLCNVIKYCTAIITTKLNGFEFYLEKEEQKSYCEMAVSIEFKLNRPNKIYYENVLYTHHFFF